MEKLVTLSSQETALEVTQTVEVKHRFTADDLLKRRAYFQSLVDKGMAGLAEVDAKLEQLNNAKR